MKTSSFLTLLLSIIVLSFTASYSSDDVWTEDLVPSARMNALGEAGVAIENNAAALFINPAAMGIKNTARLSLFYSPLQGSSHHSYLEYIYPLTDWLGSGIGTRIRLKDSDNYFQDYFVALSLRPFKFISFGSSAKFMVHNYLRDYVQAYSFNASIEVLPIKWVTLGANVLNINEPEMQYSVLGSTQYFTKDIRAGIRLGHPDYFSIYTDVNIVDFQEKSGDYRALGSYGLEIYLFSSLNLRTGFYSERWHYGLGLSSKYIDIDFALENKKDVRYSFNINSNFGVSPQVRDKQLNAKEAMLKKESEYNNIIRLFTLEDITAALEAAKQYEKDYGKEDRIIKFYEDVEEWMNNERKRNMGKINEMKKEIMIDFYHGKYKMGMKKLQNLKLLAPNYEESKYLEHLLLAGLQLEEGKYSEAESNLIEALKINPDSKEVSDMYNRLREVIKLSE